MHKQRNENVARAITGRRGILHGIPNNMTTRLFAPRGRTFDDLWISFDWLAFGNIPLLKSETEIYNLTNKHTEKQTEPSKITAK